MSRLFSIGSWQPWPQWVLRPFWAHERSKPGARYATRCFSESCLSESCLSEASSGITLILRGSRTSECTPNGIDLKTTAWNGLTAKRKLGGGTMKTGRQGGRHNGTTSQQQMRKNETCGITKLPCYVAYTRSQILKNLDKLVQLRHIFI